ncbi:MAG: DUF2569 family protein [Kiritimatiellia bacterium]
MQDPNAQSAEITENDIVFDCPHCGKSLAIDRRAAGTRVVCPDCQNQVRVPIPDDMFAQEDAPADVPADDSVPPSVTDPAPAPLPAPLPPSPPVLRLSEPQPATQVLNQQESERNRRFCTSCGAQTHEAALFCGACGARCVPLPHQATQPVPLSRLPPVLPVAAPPPGEPVGVGGWLFFLCLGLTVFRPIAVLVAEILSYSQLSSALDDHAGAWALLILDTVLNVGLTAFGIYAGIRLWRIQPGAVRTAKRFLWCTLIYLAIDVILYFILQDMLSLNERAVSHEVSMALGRGLISFGIWFAYLGCSKRVKNTYQYETPTASDPRPAASAVPPVLPVITGNRMPPSSLPAGYPPCRKSPAELFATQAAYFSLFAPIFIILVNAFLPPSVHRDRGAMLFLGAVDFIGIFGGLALGIAALKSARRHAVQGIRGVAIAGTCLCGILALVSLLVLIIWAAKAR